MAQHNLAKLWGEHTAHEFATRDTEATLATMVEDAYVNHIPILTGGHGKAALRRFYSREFIPSMPSDTTLTPISRTVGEDQLVDDALDVARYSAHSPARGGSVGRYCEIPGSEACSRAHLLGPGFGFETTRASK